MLRHLRIRCVCLLLAFFFVAAGYGDDPYQVEFRGVMDSDVVELLRSSSDLEKLKSRPPGTTAALKRRAEGDIPNFVKALHSLAYFNAQIEMTIDPKQSPPLVIFDIETGPVYPFASFCVEAEGDYPFPFQYIAPWQLGVTIGTPAYPSVIHAAEENLLWSLAQQGYPFAVLKDREVVADQSSRSIHVKLVVDGGPVAYFGPTTIIGNEKVYNRYFSKKIAWLPGQVYDPKKVEFTQQALESSRLFNEIEIAFSEELGPNNLLPMSISVREGKQRSIGAGLSFTTQRGSGVTAEWEHRNVRGIGEKFQINTNLWEDTQELSLQYVQPDWNRVGQDLIWGAEAQHIVTEGYKETSFSMSSIVEQQLNRQTRISYGALFKQLHNTKSDNDGEYILYKLPMRLRWHNTDRLLDPRIGTSLHFSVVPSLQLHDDIFAYSYNNIIGAVYVPLTSDRNWVFAAKANLGNIWGSPRRTIPPSERFYAGSENTLRGYRYLTVSPLSQKGKPIGGRSMMIYSAELRVQATDNLGWVLFSDIGNVSAAPFPRFDKKFLLSVGYGLRYYTPVGPLRLDFAVPLDRRPDLDNRFQIYVSVGQAF